MTDQEREEQTDRNTAAMDFSQYEFVRTAIQGDQPTLQRNGATLWKKPDESEVWLHPMTVQREHLVEKAREGINAEIDRLRSEDTINRGGRVDRETASRDSVLQQIEAMQPTPVKRGPDVREPEGKPDAAKAREFFESLPGTRTGGDQAERFVDPAARQAALDLVIEGLVQRGMDADKIRELLGAPDSDSEILRPLRDEYHGFVDTKTGIAGIRGPVYPVTEEGFGVEIDGWIFHLVDDVVTIDNGPAVRRARHAPSFTPVSYEQARIPAHVIEAAGSALRRLREGPERDAETGEPIDRPLAFGEDLEGCHGDIPK